eukprot:GHVH01001799.1.p1 GENE.GHVH01001799.1~~GHVH01001799.1.p1  ORF type:complete len:299 (+),score=38.21 GHVH01001799.1:355-1251(+)
MDQQHAAGCIVTKSSTIHKKSGNGFFLASSRSPPLNLQGKGSPNLGVENYLDLAELRKREGRMKQFILSIQGSAVGDFLYQIKRVIARNNRFGTIKPVDAIELNMAVQFRGETHKLGYSLDALEAFLGKVSLVEGISDLPIGLKLPPYFEKSMIESVAKIILKINRKVTTCIDYVACVYSLGNCLNIDVNREEAVLPVNNGFGGLCGPCIKPVGLGNVKRFREYLGSEIGIMGVGGVRNGADVYEYLLAGADAVQIGSTLQLCGPESITTIIATELDVIMKKKGVADPRLVRDRLRVL